VIGLVRNKSSTEQRLEKDGISNVTILAGDIVDIAALQSAAAAVAKLVGDDGLDYLINNAAIAPEGTALTNLDAV
jgi:NAD(P)-dependent dehydrogenase (short-subunit alcohol dehydrogenase family)